MALKNQYLIDLLERVKQRNQGEPEFIQTEQRFLKLLSLLLKRDRIILMQAYLRELLSLKDRLSSVYRGLTTTVRHRLTEVSEYSSTLQSDLTRAV